jgi:hypothetical protein
VQASLWHDFDGTSTAQATLASIGQSVAVVTEGIGTFAQIGAGFDLRLRNSPIRGFVRGDVRVGDKLSGEAVNAGLRLQF